MSVKEELLMKNLMEFRVWGRYALFTDPITKLGGEKCSYHIPTYEALKGIAKSIYWKPTFIWVIDKVRVMNRIQTQTRAMKPLNYSDGGNSLAIYNYLSYVEYQVQAHFEWNNYQSELRQDQNEGKHFSIATRTLEKGGRQDIFLGTRDCQAYVEPCRFGEGSGYYDDTEELSFGLMFHGFDYPDETGKDELRSRFWYPKMINGCIAFLQPQECEITQYIRDMYPKKFTPKENFCGFKEELLGELDSETV
jgi:CRISPR-associated protein Cas5d